MPRYKRYLDEMPGAPLQDIWTDFRPAGRGERLGYPTQKPLALLDRIIRASSNEGDVVLNPYCDSRWYQRNRSVGNGSGLTCRDSHPIWVVSRLQNAADAGALISGSMLPDVYHRTDVPMRTDVGKVPPYKTHRHTLYGQQEGHCAGCKHHFPFRNLTTDHIVARSKCGTDDLDNLQLLCGACNSMKGTMHQAAFLARLKRAGIGQ